MSCQLKMSVYSLTSERIKLMGLVIKYIPFLLALQMDTYGSIKKSKQHVRYLRSWVLCYCIRKC